MRKLILMIATLILVQMAIAQFEPRIILPNLTEEIAHNGAGNFVLLEGNVVYIRDSLFEITSVDTMDTSYYHRHFLGNPNTNEFYFVVANVNSIEDIMDIYLSYYDGNTWEFNIPIPIVPATDFYASSAGYDLWDIKLHVDANNDLWIFTDAALLSGGGSWISNVILMNVF